MWLCNAESASLAGVLSATISVSSAVSLSVALAVSLGVAHAVALCSPEAQHPAITGVAAVSVGAQCRYIQISFFVFHLLSS